MERHLSSSSLSTSSSFSLALPFHLFHVILLFLFLSHERASMEESFCHFLLSSTTSQSPLSSISPYSSLPFSFSLVMFSSHVCSGEKLSPHSLSLSSAHVWKRVLPPLLPTSLSFALKRMRAHMHIDGVHENSPSSAASSVPSPLSTSSLSSIIRTLFPSPCLVHAHRILT